MRIVLGCTGVWEMKLDFLGGGGASDSGANNVTLGKSYPSGSPFLKWGCPGDWGGGSFMQRNSGLSYTQSQEIAAPFPLPLPTWQRGSLALGSQQIPPAQVLAFSMRLIQLHGELVA